MKGYKLGKDMGKLMVRMQQLEKRNYPCRCSEAACSNPGISMDELGESLHNAAPDEKTYQLLYRLVTDAGEITIRDLFTKTSLEVNNKVAAAIQAAKEIGFLALSNDKCCHEVDDPFKDDYCKTKAGKWCSLVKKETKWMCTLASDKC